MFTPYDPPTDPIEILHEDADMLAVVKPAGLLSVPGRGEELADCLISRLAVTFPNIWLVHRLDRDTSGVMVFGLTPHAQRSLSMEFETRRAKKTYIARVWGKLEPREDTVDLPLTVDWPNRPRQMVCHENGRPAVTDWRVVSYGENETRVRLMPRTGRSHQLRVHMLSKGHVILGDPIYAEGKASAFPRLMLHSEELRINHPENGRGMRFRSAAPF